MISGKSLGVKTKILAKVYLLRGYTNPCKHALLCSNKLETGKVVELQFSQKKKVLRPTTPKDNGVYAHDGTGGHSKQSVSHRVEKRTAISGK